MITIGELLYQNTMRFPQKLAVADLNRRFSYAQFNGRVNRLSNALLELGVKKGDKVAIYARNSIEYLEVFYATAKTGAVLVTLNFWLRMSEVAVLCNHSDATFLILEEQFQEPFVNAKDQFHSLADTGVIIIGRPMEKNWYDYHELVNQHSGDDPGIKVDWQDPYWMLYTSGTTGNPKGLIRSHGRTALCSWYPIMEFGYAQEDYFLAISPFFHGVTFFALMMLQLGGSVFVMREFDPDQALRIINEEGITTSFMVPTMLDMILSSPVLSGCDTSSLRILITGAAPLPTLVKKKIIEAFGPVLYEFYAASESGYLTAMHPRDQERKTRSCGQACFGASIEIRDSNGNPVGPGEVGELWSKCAGRFDEYYKAPEKTAEVLMEGWFTAGDLATRDEENFFYIVDRKKDMIISGGENIYPREIEDVIRFIPDVEDCAVIGVPDPLWGEAVKAFVVSKSGHSLTAEKITAHCNKHLAGFKKPKFVQFVDDLPRTASGKVMKKELRSKETINN